MILITLIALALAAVLLWSLYAEEVPPRPRFRPRPLDLTMPAAELRRHDAPVVLAGYDPRWVDTHVRQLVAMLDHVRAQQGPRGADGGAPGLHPMTSPDGGGSGGTDVRAGVRDLAAQQHLDRSTAAVPPSVLDG